MRLLSDEFINKVTDFNNLQEFMKAGNLNNNDILNGGSKKADNFIKGHSKLDSIKSTKGLIRCAKEFNLQKNIGMRR